MFTIYKKIPEILVGNFRSVRTVRVVYHLPKISGLSHRTRLDSEGAFHLLKISGISGSAVNGTRFVGSSHWKISGTNRNSEKVVPVSLLGLSEWKFVIYHLQVS